MGVLNIIGPLLLIILALSDVKTAELYVADQGKSTKLLRNIQ